MSDNSFLNTSSTETYDDIPSGQTGSRGFIGHAQAVRRWDCGWLAEDKEFNGQAYKSGKIYFNGTKEQALELAKSVTGAEYVNSVMLISMAVPSVTNLNDEAKAKFSSGVISAAARVVGLKTDKPITLDNQKYAAGLNLVTVPSLVEAYAIFKGWYKEPFLSPDLFNGIDKKADLTEFIAKLVEIRQMIWATLGEKTTDANYADATSPKLKEALDQLVLRQWDAWVRFYTVSDPSPKASYEGKDKEDETKMVLKRNRVPFVAAFFKGEKDAIEAGKAEISDKPAAAAKDFASVYLKLSEKAKATYSAVDWQAVAESIVSDLKAGKSVPSVAKEYELAVGDVNLVKTA